jgi:hypothetical protein
MYGHNCLNGTWIEGSDWWRESDANGIYLCKVCERCQDEKLSGYRPEILRGYSQADVDEPIDAESDACGFEVSE